MHLRRLAACAVALALLPAVPPVAAATRKPACRHLIVDARGDAMTGAPETHDILLADMALGRTELTAVLTLAAGGPVGTAEVTSTWELGWVANGLRYTFTAARGAADNRFQTLVTVDGLRLPHAFTATGSSLVWRVKSSHMKALSSPKAVIRDATASTAILLQTDTAKQQASWSRASSCLRAK